MALRTRFDRILEQLTLLGTFVRVLRGEDPVKVKAQHEELVTRAHKLKQEIESYGKPTGGADG